MAAQPKTPLDPPKKKKNNKSKKRKSNNYLINYDDPDLKVVVRLLPPTLKQASFLEQTFEHSPIAKDEKNWTSFYYQKGSPASKPFEEPVFSRAYFEFTSRALAEQFRNEVKTVAYTEPDTGDQIMCLTMKSIFGAVGQAPVTEGHGEIAGDPVFVKYMALRAAKSKDIDVVALMNEITSAEKQKNKESRRQEQQKSKKKRKQKAQQQNGSEDATTEQPKAGEPQKVKSKKKLKAAAATPTSDTPETPKKEETKKKKPKKKKPKAAGQDGEKDVQLLTPPASTGSEGAPAAPKKPKKQRQKKPKVPASTDLPEKPST